MLKITQFEINKRINKFLALADKYWTKANGTKEALFYHCDVSNLPNSKT